MPLELDFAPSRLTARAAASQLLEEGAGIDELAARSCVQSSVDELELYILGDDRLGRIVLRVRRRGIAVARARLHGATLARVPQARQRSPDRKVPPAIEELLSSVVRELEQPKELRHTRSAQPLASRDLRP